MKYLTLALTALIFLSCSTEKKNPDKRLHDKEVPAEFEIGEAKNGVYKNDFFQFSFRYNTTMHIMSYEELEETLDPGTSKKKTKKEKQIYEASKVRTASLFGGFKYPLDSYYDSNPNLIIMAENMKGIPNVQYGDDYLEIMRDQLDQNNTNYEQIGAILEAKWGGTEVYKLSSGIKSPFVTDGYAAYQDFYCTVIKEFALIFVVTYSNEEESGFMDDILKTIVFK